MSKQTFLMVSEKGFWVGHGQAGNAVALQSISWNEFEENQSGSEWGKTISKYFGEKRLTKRGLQVVLDPCLTELRPISVPPVDQKSLPPIVHIQSKSQLVTASEKADIDFCPMIGYQAGTPGSVIASTFNINASDLFQQLKSDGFQFQSILPRSLSLLNLKTDSSTSCLLWVNILKNQIEFSLSGDQKLGVVRFAVIPENGDGRTRAIKREIARTLSVIASQSFGNVKYSGHVHSASEEDSAVAVEALDDAGISAKSYQLSDFGKDSSNSDIDPSVKLTAMGLLTSSKSQPIDYANPTKPPKEKADLRQYITGALVAAVVIFGIGYWAWANLQSVYKETEELEQKIASKVGQENENKLLVNKVSAIDAELAKDPNWLNELQVLSSKLPYGDKIQLNGISIGTSGGRASRIKKADQVMVSLSTGIDNKQTLDIISDLFKTDESRNSNIPRPTPKGKNGNYQLQYQIDYARKVGTESSALNYVEYRDKLDAAAKPKTTETEEGSSEDDKKEKSNNEKDSVIRTATDPNP